MSNNPDSTDTNHLGRSSHYVVCRDGTVIQMVRDRDIAHHAGNFPYNERSIGIEHERHGTSNWTEAQFGSSAALVTWLASQYDIEIVFPAGIAPADPATGTGIIAHAQVPDPFNPAMGGGSGHHTDPVSWDWGHYRHLFDEGPDATPDPFAFASQTGVPLGATVTSNAVTITGIEAPASISVTGGTYSINGAAYTAAAGTILNNAAVAVRFTASSAFATQRCATVTVGGISGQFCATTLAAPLNRAPSVDAGADQTISFPAAATLHGTVTDVGVPSALVVATWS
jgi:hypothetical protein